MVLQELRLKNFRAHADTRVTFASHLNFLTGGNAQGKTSVLEAIYFLCTTRNFKGVPDDELLRMGEQEYELEAVFGGAAESSSRVYYANGKKRAYLHNGKQVHRAADIIGRYPVALLTPDDHALTQGGPADRRKFLDQVISQSSEAYLQTLLDYTKTLRHRNALLGRLKEGNGSTRELDAWDERLAASGAELYGYRARFAAELSGHLEQTYAILMEREEVPLAVYPAPGSTSYGSNPRQGILQGLAARRQEEIRRGVTLTGPHRDDIAFSINGVSVKQFASQGQHKTFQVALRFAQFFYLKEKTGTTPIFLLDDVFGEVDRHRARRISEYLQQVGQAFITITDLANLSFLAPGPTDSVYTVSRGSVSLA